MLCLITFVVSCHQQPQQKSNESSTISFATDTLKIKYVGEDDFKQGMSFQINDLLFVHDSMCLLKLHVQDTIFLPTKTYIQPTQQADRHIYNQTSALQVMQLIAQVVHQKSNASIDAIDIKKVLTLGELTIVGKQPIQVKLSKNYPLKVE